MVRANTEVEARKRKKKIVILQWLWWCSDKLTMASPTLWCKNWSEICHCGPPSVVCCHDQMIHKCLPNLDISFVCLDPIIPIIFAKAAVVPPPLAPPRHSLPSFHCRSQPMFYIGSPHMSEIRTSFPPGQCTAYCALHLLTHSHLSLNQMSENSITDIADFLSFLNLLSAISRWLNFF